MWTFQAPVGSIVLYFVWCFYLFSVCHFSWRFEFSRNYFLMAVQIDSASLHGRLFLGLWYFTWFYSSGDFLGRAKVLSRFGAACVGWLWASGFLGHAGQALDSVNLGSMLLSGLVDGWKLLFLRLCQITKWLRNVSAFISGLQHTLPLRLFSRRWDLWIIRLHITSFYINALGSIGHTNLFDSAACGVIIIFYVFQDWLMTSQEALKFAGIELLWVIQRNWCLFSIKRVIVFN